MHYIQKRKNTRTTLFALFTVLILAFISACASEPQTPKTPSIQVVDAPDVSGEASEADAATDTVVAGEDSETEAVSETEAAADAELPEGATEREVEDASWKTTELLDVVSGEQYSISDFAGKPVLLESFAVWCPVCAKQQKVLKEFHELVGDDVISIGLDTDPNEDADKVREHATTNGFDWRFSVAPPEMTQELIDEFGIAVINAPTVPIVLICPDGSASLLKSGVKEIAELQEAIAGCSN